MDWIHQQNKAIVYGSALRGRPLRVYMPAFSLEETFNSIGYDADGSHDPNTEEGRRNRIAYALRAFAEYANRNQAIIDQHMRYTDYGQVGTVWEALTNPTSFNSAWARPDQIGVLETAPDPSVGWLDPTRKAFIAEEYYIGCGDNNVIESWNSYVRSKWELDQFEQDGGFRVSDMYQDHYNYGALHALWGHYDQDSAFVDCAGAYPYHVPPLKATTFHDVGNSQKWSEFKGEYVTAVGNLLIDPLTPHINGCPCQYPQGGN